MTDNTKNILITIGIILVLVALSFFVGRCSKQPENVVRYVTKIDTAWKETPAKPLIVEGKGKIYYKVKDSIVYVGVLKDTCTPFVSVLDTIIKKDTLQARYSYPQNTFNILLRPHPDSIMTRTIYVQLDPPKEKQTVWENILYYGSTAVAAYLLGRATK